MKLKSKIVRIIYFTDSKKLNKNLLRNILNKQIDDKEVEMDRINSETESLKNHNLITTYHSNGSEVFKLTDEGETRVEKLLTDSEVENKIRNLAENV
jgi:ribonuclease HII